MTKKEIISIFESGEEATVTFGIRKRFFSVGKHRITERQFRIITETFKGKYSINIIGTGFTKHVYKFNTPH